MPSSIARDIFENLPGAWTLSRIIRDARLGCGHFNGEASFAARGSALLYEERGELELAAWRGPVWRRWLYACEGDALVIRYPNTDVELHAFRFVGDARSAEHTHLCGDDRYHATLAYAPSGAISLGYVVTGRAKDYRLRTVLTRVV